MSINKYRLSGEVYEREDNSAKIPPAKIIYLSVEGNVTEREYFECLSNRRRQLGINTLVTVEVLKRQDTNSAPRDVIELLEEYVELRNMSGESEESQLPEEFRKDHSEDEVNMFLNDTMEKEQKKVFLGELRKLGFDIAYRKYLKAYRNADDEFGIVIDRDCSSHSAKNMQDCIKHCKAKGYLCYISNPCFEFWLLLHLCDVKAELAGHLVDIKNNRKVSHKHTYVSLEVSKRAGHGKGNLNFDDNYLNNIPLAVRRAKDFAQTEEELVNDIGTNLWKLIEKLQEYK